MRYMPMYSGGLAMFVGFAAFVATLLVIAAIVAIVIASRRKKGLGPVPPRPMAPPALQVLDERLARGEIEIDDYLNRKAALLGGVPSPAEWRPGPTEPSAAAPGAEQA